MIRVSLTNALHKDQLERERRDEELLGQHSMVMKTIERIQSEIHDLEKRKAHTKANHKLTMIALGDRFEHQRTTVEASMHGRQTRTRFKAITSTLVGLETKIN